MAELAGEENEQGVRALYHLLLDHSRLRQQLDGQPESQLGRQIREAASAMPAFFPEKAMVACQVVEGAYSQLACEKMVRYPSIMYCRTFENVFSAIESGLCQYGVLPIEKSLAGSVNSVYNLMIRQPAISSVPRGSRSTIPCWPCPASDRKRSGRFTPTSRRSSSVPPSCRSIRNGM